MKKIIILLLFTLFLTGCSATYNVEIYKGKIKEEFEYFETSSENLDKLSRNKKTYREEIKKSVDYPYAVFVDAAINEDDTKKIEGVEYYDNLLIEDSNKLGQKLSYRKFSFGDYNRSSIIRSCYEYFNIVKDDDNNYVLSTSMKNSCFDKYELLDSITVNLKTNHKVIDSNADHVNGYHYTWNITRDNKDDAAIYIKMYKDKYIFNYENEFVKKVLTIGIIIGIITISGYSAYKYYKKKNDSLNEI